MDGLLYEDKHAPRELPEGTFKKGPVDHAELLERMVAKIKENRDNIRQENEDRLIQFEEEKHMDRNHPWSYYNRAMVFSILVNKKHSEFQVGRYFKGKQHIFCFL